MSTERMKTYRKKGWGSRIKANSLPEKGGAVNQDIASPKDESKRGQSDREPRRGSMKEKERGQKRKRTKGTRGGEEEGRRSERREKGKRRGTAASRCTACPKGPELQTRR